MHRRSNGFCWVCVGLNHRRVASLLTNAEETDGWWPERPDDQAPAVVPLDSQDLARVSGPPSSSSGATSSSPTAGPTSCLRRELYPITPLVVSTVACVEAMGPGYLSVDSDVVIEILYMGDPEDVDQAGWVYAEIRANGRRGWLPITALPSSIA